MKGKKEVATFLRSVNPYQLKDELAIEAYCRRQGLRIRYKPSPKNTRNITFEQFVYWFNNVCPLKNDVVVVDKGIIGIVKESQFKCITMGAYLDPETGFITEELNITSRNFSPATVEEKITLQNEFCKQGLAWNKQKAEIVARNTPMHNQQIRVTLLGEKTGLGVLREIRENGDVIMYCFWEFDTKIRYSLHENLGNQCQYQFEDVNFPERQLLAKELAKEHKIWNGRLERIEPVNYRAEKGDTFHFINNFLEIEVSKEQRRQKNLILFKSSNYFRSWENCENLRKLFQSEIKKHPIANRATQGAMYYFINENWEIQENTDNDKPKDSKLHATGNYFTQKKTAYSILDIITQERKKQLVNSSIDSPKKRGRKPKIIQYPKN